MRHTFCQSRRAKWVVWLGTLLAGVSALTLRDPGLTYAVWGAVALGHLVLYFYRRHCDARFMDGGVSIHQGCVTRRKVGVSSSENAGPVTWTVFVWFSLPQLAPIGFDRWFETETEKLNWLAHHPTDLGERWHYRTFPTKQEALVWMRLYRVGTSHGVQLHPHAKQEVVLVSDPQPPQEGFFYLALALIYLPLFALLCAHLLH